MQLGLLYTSCSGGTKRAASLIHQGLAGACSAPIDLSQVANWEQLRAFSGYIVGTPTYNTDASMQRTGTAWDDVLYNGSAQQLQLKVRCADDQVAWLWC